MAVDDEVVLVDDDRRDLTKLLQKSFEFTPLMLVMLPGSVRRRLHRLDRQIEDFKRILHIEDS